MFTFPFNANNYSITLPQNLRVLSHDNGQTILDLVFQRLSILPQVLQPRRLYLDLSAGVRGTNRRQTVRSHRDVAGD